MSTATLERPSAFSTDYLIDQHTAQRSAVTDQALSQTLTAWDQLENLDAEAEVESFLSKLFPVVESAQVLTGHVTASYLTSMVALATGEPALPVGLALEAVTNLRPTPIAQVYRRPLIVAATALGAGATILVARKVGRDRLARLVHDDLGMAHRAAAKEVFSRDGRIVGYRRVIRPEVSEDGVCGLCVAASDVRYGKADLMPIHTRCACGVAPIVRRSSGKISDPGRVVNNHDIAALYERTTTELGTTDADVLAQVRYAVHEHGELGPVLRRADDTFRGPAAVAAADRPPRQTRTDAPRRDET